MALPPVWRRRCSDRVGARVVSAGYVVVVEDSMLVADALRILFVEHDYEVDVAGSVADAVQICTARVPDVLLLDLTLPDGDGLEVLSRLDAQKASRPRRSIALTGHGDVAVQLRCLRAGCERVMVKPVSIRELLGIVRGQ